MVACLGLVAQAEAPVGLQEPHEPYEFKSKKEKLTPLGVMTGASVPRRNLRPIWIMCAARQSWSMSLQCCTPTLVVLSPAATHAVFIHRSAVSPMIVTKAA